MYSLDYSRLKKKTYCPYSGFIEKLKKPIELKLSKNKSEMKGGSLEPKEFYVNYNYRTTNNKTDGVPKFKYNSSTFGKDQIFFGKKINLENESSKYFSIVLASDGSFCILTIDPITKQFTPLKI